RSPRLHESTVPLVANRDVLELRAFEFQVRMNVIELDPGGGSQTVAAPLGALQVHSRPASSGAPRTQVGRSERRVQSGAKLVAIEPAALLLVPFGKPLFTQRTKFVPGQLAVPLLTALLRKNGRYERCRTKRPGPTRPATARTAASAEKSSPGL